MNILKQFTLITFENKNNMIGLEKVRQTFKISFHLLQIMIICSGVCSLLLSFILYLRSNTLLSISPQIMLCVMSVCILTIVNGYLGFSSLNSDRKTNVVLFILTMVTIMNFQIIFAVKYDKIVEKREVWTNDRWESFTEVQKDYVEKQFQCCGLETTQDRPTKLCKFDNPCSAVFKSIAKTMRKIIQKSLIYMFFVESVSLTILAFLKFIK